MVILPNIKFPGVNIIVHPGTSPDNQSDFKIRLELGLYSTICLGPGGDNGGAEDSLLSKIMCKWYHHGTLELPYSRFRKLARHAGIHQNNTNKVLLSYLILSLLIFLQFDSFS